MCRSRCGARPPGRGPPCTSSVGARPSRTSERLTAPIPSSRHRGEIPHDDDRRRFDGGEERVVGRLGEQRLGGDADDLLHGQRRVCEEPACVPPAPTRVGLRADEPQGQGLRSGEPGGELERRPVVHAAAERDEDPLAARPVGPRA